MFISNDCDNIESVEQTLIVGVVASDRIVFAKSRRLKLSMETSDTQIEEI